MASNNSKQLYSILNTLTCKSNKLILPSDTPVNVLPDKFNSFFVDKISKLRNNLDSVNTALPTEHVTFSDMPLSSFSSVNEDYVKSIIMKSKKIFCELDSLPGNVFIQCVDTLLPYMTSIFNASLESGVFPVDFKDSLITPLIKQPSLDCNILKNYRPFLICLSFQKFLKILFLSKLLTIFMLIF